MKKYKSQPDIVEEFIHSLLIKYNISLEETFYKILQDEEKISDILAIFNLSTEEEKELCLTMLAMISIKNPNSILLEFRENNELMDLKFDSDTFNKIILKNKVLIATSMMYNADFTNSALLLCSYMGRRVLDKTQEFIYEVSRDRFAIKEVPFEYQLDNEEICLSAVRFSGRALKDVKNKTFEVCLAAVKKYGLAIRYVFKAYPAKLSKEQLYQICVTAIQRNGSSLQYIFSPNNDVKFDKEQNINLCKLAVETDPLALEYIPIHLFEPDGSLNKEFCLNAIKRNSLAYNYTPEKPEWVEDFKREKDKRKAEEDKMDKKNIFILIDKDDFEYYTDEKKNIEIKEYVGFTNGQFFESPEQEPDTAIIYGEGALKGKHIKKYKFNERKLILKKNCFTQNELDEIIIKCRPLEIDDDAFDNPAISKIIREIPVKYEEGLEYNLNCNTLVLKKERIKANG